MTIERARVLAEAKPWGVIDLRPWSSIGDGATLIGELRFARTNPSAPASALLLKLLFTSAPLSIQVHPDDAYAMTQGEPNGKSEAWHVLAAAPRARVAVGLLEATTRAALRLAIEDGSITRLVDWRPVTTGDTISVPAGTIHAIGAGLIIAEIQQRSETTFRLFDYGRRRALHIDEATAMADPGRAQTLLQPERLSAERLLLACNDHFVFERISLRPDTIWRFDARRETWLFVIAGTASAGSLDLVRGDAIFAQDERAVIEAGRLGLDCLVGYTGGGGPVAQLLQPTAPQTAIGSAANGPGP